MPENITHTAQRVRAKLCRTAPGRLSRRRSATAAAFFRLQKYKSRRAFSKEMLSPQKAEQKVEILLRLRESEEKKRGGSLTHTHKHTIQLLGNKTCGACTFFFSLAALPPSRGKGTCVLQELSVSPQYLIHLVKLLFKTKRRTSPTRQKLILQRCLGRRE